MAESKWDSSSSEAWLAAARREPKPFAVGDLSTNKKKRPKTAKQWRSRAKRVSQRCLPPRPIHHVKAEVCPHKCDNKENTHQDQQMHAKKTKQVNMQMLQRGERFRRALQRAVEKAKKDRTSASCESHSASGEACEQLVLLDVRLGTQLQALKALMGAGPSKQDARQALRRDIAAACRLAASKVEASTATGTHATDDQAEPTTIMTQQTRKRPRELLSPDFSHPHQLGTPSAALAVQKQQRDPVVETARPGGAGTRSGRKRMRMGARLREGGWSEKRHRKHRVFERTVVAFGGDDGAAPTASHADAALARGDSGKVVGAGVGAGAGGTPQRVRTQTFVLASTPSDWRAERNALSTLRKLDEQALSWWSGAVEEGGSDGGGGATGSPSSTSSSKSSSGSRKRKKTGVFVFGAAGSRGGGRGGGGGGSVAVAVARAAAPEHLPEATPPVGGAACAAASASAGGGGMGGAFGSSLLAQAQAQVQVQGGGRLFNIGSAPAAAAEKRKGRGTRTPMKQQQQRRRQARKGARRNRNQQKANKRSRR